MACDCCDDNLTNLNAGNDGQSSYLYIIYADDIEGTNAQLTIPTCFVAIVKSNVSMTNNEAITYAISNDLFLNICGADGEEGPQGPQGDPGITETLYYQYIEQNGNALPQQSTLNYIGNLVNVTNNLTGQTDVEINNKIYYCDLTIKNNYVPESGIINKVTPSAAINIPRDGQIITKYTRIVSNSVAATASTTSGSYVGQGGQPTVPTCSFGSMNNVTGVFTISQTGLYLLKASVHLKPDNGTTIYWSTTSNGQIGLGLTPDNGTDIYFGNYQSVLPNITTEIDITTSGIIYLPEVPRGVKLKILNTTTRDYDGTGYANGDGIRFAIVKLY